MSLETAAAAGGLKQQPASDVTVVSLSSTSSATSRPRVSRTPSQSSLHAFHTSDSYRYLPATKSNNVCNDNLDHKNRVTTSVYSTSNNNVSASNLKVAATRGLTRAHPQNQLRKGKKHARIHAPLHRRGLIHQQHHEEGIKSSSPTDSLPPLSSAFSPSSTATATTTATTTLTKRRLQAFLYPAHVAHDPFLSLDQLRFRQFVLLASSNTDTTTAVSTTITAGNSNSKSQDENEQQPNYPKRAIVTLPIPSSNSVSTTITKRSGTAWAHPTDRPRSRNKESLDHQGHLGRGCHHCIEIPCCCRERSSITTAANEIHARQRTSSLLPLTATNPFCTITEEDEELKMPLSLRVKDLHPFPRRSNTVSSIHTTKSDSTITATSPTYLKATTIENQTITIPADSPSQSPLILEPALSTITDASSTSTSSSSTIIAGENGNKGRMWYRKMSQWPPSEFVDPFAAGPIVVVASSSSSNANAGDVRGGHHVKKKNVPACVERVEVKLLDGKIVDAVLGALPPGPKSNVPATTHTSEALASTSTSLSLVPNIIHAASATPTTMTLDTPTNSASSGGLGSALSAPSSTSTRSGTTESLKTAVSPSSTAVTASTATGVYAYSTQDDSSETTPLSPISPITSSPATTSVLRSHVQTPSPAPLSIRTPSPEHIVQPYPHSISLTPPPSPTSPTNTSKRLTRELLRGDMRFVPPSSSPAKSMSIESEMEGGKEKGKKGSRPGTPSFRVHVPAIVFRRGKSVDAGRGKSEGKAEEESVPLPPKPAAGTGTYEMFSSLSGSPKFSDPPVVPLPAELNLSSLSFGLSFSENNLLDKKGTAGALMEAGSPTVLEAEGERFVTAPTSVSSSPISPLSPLLPLSTLPPPSSFTPPGSDSTHRRLKKKRPSTAPAATSSSSTTNFSSPSMTSFVFDSRPSSPLRSTEVVAVERSNDRRHPSTTSPTLTGSQLAPASLPSSILPILSAATSTSAHTARFHTTCTAGTTLSRPTTATSLEGNTMSITSGASSSRYSTVASFEGGADSLFGVPPSYMRRSRRGSGGSSLFSGEWMSTLGGVAKSKRKSLREGSEDSPVPPLPPLPSEFRDGGMPGSTVSLPTTGRIGIKGRSNTVSGGGQYPTWTYSHRIPSYLRPRGGSGRTRASSPPTPDASHTLDKLRRLSRTLEDLTLFDDALGLGGVSSVGDPWTLILNPNADAEAKSGVLLEVAAAGGSSSSGGGSLLSGRSGGGSKEGQKEGKRKEKFDEWEGLSTAQVWRAAQMEVIDTEGKKVKFGSLFEEQRTICCFIRHFWCPFCQDYLRSIVDNAPPAKLDKAGVKLIIVSNGSHKLAKAYQENVFKCPYPIYVDPSRELYRAFGMTRCTINGGPESEKGAYVVHGPIGGLGMALRNAMKMPLGNAGDIKQLGGEFILGPGIRCEYAHRMPTTRGHVDIRTLLSITRVDRVSEEGERSRDKLEVDIDHPRKKEWDALMRWKEKRGKGKWELFDDLASEEDMVAPYDCSDQDQACDTEEDGWGKRTMRDLLALIPQDPDVDEVARHESSPLMATSAG